MLSLVRSLVAVSDRSRACHHNRQMSGRELLHAMQECRDFKQGSGSEVRGVVCPARPLVLRAAILIAKFAERYHACSRDVCLRLH